VLARWVKKHHLSSLRVLGTVGEPINPEVWLWYRDLTGGGRCPIVGTSGTKTVPPILASRPPCYSFSNCLQISAAPGASYAVSTLWKSGSDSRVTIASQCV
jgi:acyl-coenzyme A synthetase/AMP-(fatty) acid ligase